MPMDTLVSMTGTQSLVFWILLGLLLMWMITFAVLAFRSKVTEDDEEGVKRNIYVKRIL